MDVVATGYGFAKFGTDATSLVGTKIFSTPEVQCVTNSDYGNSVDISSLGMTL